MKLCVSKKGLKYWMATVLLTLPYLKTGFFQQFSTLDLMIDLWKIISFLIVFVWYFFVHRKVSKMIVLFATMEGYLLFNTFIHGGNMQSCANSAFSILGVTLLYDMLEDFKYEFLSAQLFCFELILICLRKLCFQMVYIVEQGILRTGFWDIIISTQDILSLH